VVRNLMRCAAVRTWITEHMGRADTSPPKLRNLKANIGEEVQVFIMMIIGRGTVPHDFLNGL
jgi:hypothetical protein